MSGSTRKNISSQSSLICSTCKKRTLIDYSCSCKRVLCIKCRAPEQHNCDFDFFKENQNRLLKDNPVIVGEKVDKI